MHFLVKLALANAVLITAAQLGKRNPSLAGLLATMPLTSLLVLVWLHAENPGDTGRLVAYTKGVVWGIGPSVAFFVVALLGFQRNLSLPWTLAASFAVWFAGALAHRWLLG